MKIAIYGANCDKNFLIYIKQLFTRLESEKVELAVYKPFYDFLTDEFNLKIKSSYFNNPQESPDDVDFLFSIGGDGTFLASIRYLKSSEIPVIGINTGRLGFLANISKEEIDPALDAIFNGEHRFEYRSLLRVESDIDLFDGYNFALNEVTIQKKDSALISIDAWLNDDFINTYWTDGLIIATPTGSTAYSLSVGGPIVAPGSNNFIIAPIASHNLTVRPLVVSDTAIIKLRIATRNTSYLITVDNMVQELNADQSVIYIRKSKFELKMLRLPFNNYYATLRNKLMWGMDKRN